LCIENLRRCFAVVGGMDMFGGAGEMDLFGDIETVVVDGVEVPFKSLKSRKSGKEILEKNRSILSQTAWVREILDCVDHRIKSSELDEEASDSTYEELMRIISALEKMGSLIGVLKSDIPGVDFGGAGLPRLLDPEDFGSSGKRPLGPSGALGSSGASEKVNVSEMRKNLGFEDKRASAKDLKEEDVRVEIEKNKVKYLGSVGVSASDSTVNPSRIAAVVNEFLENIGLKKIGEDLAGKAKTLVSDLSKMPASQMVFVAVCLGYLVTPIDLIPDVIPGVGFLDDLIAVKMAMDSVSGSISKAAGVKN
jgi:hypothetical protein